MRRSFLCTVFVAILSATLGAGSGEADPADSPPVRSYVVSGTVAPEFAEAGLVLLLLLGKRPPGLGPEALSIETHHGFGPIHQIGVGLPPGSPTPGSPNTFMAPGPDGAFYLTAATYQPLDSLLVVAVTPEGSVVLGEPIATATVEATPHVERRVREGGCFREAAVAYDTTSYTYAFERYRIAP